MYSLRIKLNDVIGKDEQVILENIRRCKQFAGKEFRIIFRNDKLSESIKNQQLSNGLFILVI